MPDVVFCGRHGVPEPCADCNATQGADRDRMRQEFLKAVREHTFELRRVARLLEQAGVQDPARKQIRQPPARFPGASSPPGPLTQVVEHLARAFPPDFLRGLAEDFADDLARSARRRRRR